MPSARRRLPLAAALLAVGTPLSAAADDATPSVDVTHDQVEAMTMGDHFVVLREGRLEREDVAWA